MATGFLSKPWITWLFSYQKLHTHASCVYSGTSISQTSGVANDILLPGNNKTYGGEPQYYSILFSEDIFTALGPFHIHVSRFHCSSYVDLFSSLIGINSCRRVFIIMLTLNLYQVKMYKLHVLMVFLCIHLCTKK